MIPDKFQLTSPVFEEGKAIPTKYAHKGVRGGQNVSIPLRWENPPASTLSFALACVDLHPVANKWVHWLVVNISKNVREFPEGISRTDRVPEGSSELINSYGEMGYGGPQPPRGTGPHKYEFTLYALDVEMLEVSVTASLSAFLKSIDGKVVGTAKTVGVFEQ
jgi:Raf kinase inhibitor-like YbhB/YbcL family protein